MIVSSARSWGLSPPGWRVGPFLGAYPVPLVGTIERGHNPTVRPVEAGDDEEFGQFDHRPELDPPGFDGGNLPRCGVPQEHPELVAAGSPIIIGPSGQCRRRGS